MSIDVQSLLVPREVAEQCRTTEHSVGGWIKRGVRGRDGERRFLRPTKIGGKVYVSPADLDAFLDALNG